jgi:hypothetical protein
MAPSALGNDGAQSFFEQHKKWLVPVGVIAGGYFIARALGFFGDKRLFANPEVRDPHYQDHGATGHVPGVSGEQTPYDTSLLKEPGYYASDKAFVGACLQVESGALEPDISVVITTAEEDRGEVMEHMLAYGRNVFSPVDWVGPRGLFWRFLTFAMLPAMEKSKPANAFSNQQYDYLFRIWLELGMPDGALIPKRARGVIANIPNRITKGKNTVQMIEEIPERLRTPRVVWQMILIPNIDDIISLAKSKWRGVGDWIFDIIRDSAKMIYEARDKDLWKVRRFIDKQLHRPKPSGAPSPSEIKAQLTPVWPEYEPLADMNEREFINAYYEDPKEAWIRLAGRLPARESLHDLEIEAITSIPLKNFLRVMRSGLVDDIPGARNVDQAAIGLAVTFGPDFRSWLSKMERRGISKHDATYWLPKVESPGLGRYLLKFWQAAPRKLHKIAAYWNNLTPEEQLLRPNDLMALLVVKQYGDAEIERFAQVAGVCGISPSGYKEMEDRYASAIEQWHEAGRPENIPAADATYHGYRMYKLDRDDPRGLFLGKYTDCCQYPHAAGGACAWYGLESPDSCFFVVENSAGEIVAQSWTWRNGDVVVFDNIEGKGLGSSPERQQIIKELYTEVARQLVDDPENEINEVRVGWGYMGGFRSPWPAATTLTPLPNDYRHGYSDATRSQFVIASAEG